MKPLQVALLKVGIDLGIFQTLMQSKGPVTLDGLTRQTRASR